MGLQAERWLEKYREDFGDYQHAAKRAEELIAEALRGRALDIHVVSARAKDPDSVAEKIERRSYGNPALQFDDLIGVRVITLYEHSVPLVAERLRDRFEVDAKRSANKSAKLKTREVGYRSDHLVLKVGRTGDSQPTARLFQRTFVEVQIRSVVSHAWAEIEHSLRYKAGHLPETLSRRFDALAGTLELVDREFSAIERSLVGLVELQTTQMLSEGADLATPLTPISLLAALSALRPAMNRLGPSKLALPIEDAYRATKTLASANIATVSDLKEWLDRDDFRRAVRIYSDGRGDVDPANVSATVVLGIVVGLAGPAVFAKVRRFQLDPDLVEAIQQVA